MLRVLSGLCVDAGRTWCKLMHPDPMWPVNGKYICPTCQRTYPVPWEAKEEVQLQHHGPELVHIRASAGGERVAA